MKQPTTCRIVPTTEYVSISLDGENWQFRGVSTALYLILAYDFLKAAIERDKNSNEGIIFDNR